MKKITNEELIEMMLNDNLQGIFTYEISPYDLKDEKTKELALKFNSALKDLEDYLMDFYK